MKTFLLTSAGTDVKEEIIKILPKLSAQLSMAYIVTACNGEGGYQEGKDEDLPVLKEMGFSITVLELENKSQKEVEEALRGKDVVFVQGGNTFYLLKHVKESGFDKVIDRLVSEGVIYIGVSAGSIIASPNIECAGWKNLDKNDVGLADLTSLNWVPFNIFPHYTEQYRDMVREESKKSKYPTRILTDDQAFLVIDNTVKLVGKGEEITIL